MESRNTSWLAVAVVGILASGCYTTTFSFERTPDVAHGHTAVRRESTSSPIESSWSQKQDALVGTLSWKKACEIEEHTQVNTEQVKSVVPHKRAYAALTALGIGLTLAGGALFSASSSRTDRENCSTGVCTDAGLDTSTGAASLAVAGLVTTLVSAAALAKKPVVSREKVGQTEQVRIVARGAACGDPALLAGLRVSVAIPGAGRWDAEAEKDGTLRIALPSTLDLPSEGVDLSVVVEDVPPSAAGLLSRGDRIGRVRVGPSPKAQRANRQPTEQPAQRTRNPA
jgi:hypothetical protein